MRRLLSSHLVSTYTVVEASTFEKRVDSSEGPDDNRRAVGFLCIVPSYLISTVSSSGYSVGSRRSSA